MVGRRLVADLRLSLLVLHDEQELGIGDAAVLVNVELGNAPLSLGLLVPCEAAGDDGEHLVFRDEPALVRVELGELLPDLGFSLTLSHSSSNLLDEGPELLAGDDAVAIRVKELESLSQFLLGRHDYLLNLCLLGGQRLQNSPC